MSPSRSAAGDTTSDVRLSRIARCRHTLLTKPECHCPQCLLEQIATHGRGVEPLQRVAPTRAA